MRRALLVIVAVGALGCAQKLEELGPFPCADDGECPDDFVCLPRGVAGDNSCDSANDGTCDEPGDCEYLTDSTDCAATPIVGSADPTCDYENDGECDEPGGTGICAPGTDVADCGSVPVVDGAPFFVCVADDGDGPDPEPDDRLRAICERSVECFGGDIEQCISIVEARIDAANATGDALCEETAQAFEENLVCLSAVACNDEATCSATTDAINELFFQQGTQQCLSGGPPVQAPASWTCVPGFFGGDDGCDCGCGAVDADCRSGGCADPGCNDDSVCDFCFDANGFNESACQPDFVALFSDGSWLGIGTDGEEPGPNWQTLGFDTTGWTFTDSPAPNDCGTLRLTPSRPHEIRPALTMWAEGDRAAAFFRGTFDVPDVNAVTSAVFTVVADDDFRLFVNGSAVFDELNGTGGPEQIIDVRPFLQNGLNLVAVEARDSAGGCRWLMLTGAIFLPR